MKVEIRRAKKGDEKGIAEIFKEGLKRENFVYTGTNEPFSKERLAKWKKRLANKNPESYTFVAIDKEKNKLVGTTTFHFRKTGRTRHRVDFGWVVHPDYQKKGVATNLLKTALKFAKSKGFKKAEAELAVKNKSSEKLSKKLGFKIEGRKKDGLLLDNGKYVDTYTVGKVLK